MSGFRRLGFGVALSAAALTVMSLPAMSEVGPPGSPDAPGASAAVSPAASYLPIKRLTWQVVSQRPHDTGAFTQGLLLDDTGALYESTGKVGKSTVRQVDPLTGVVLRSVPVPGDGFGEGLALVDGRLIQLTWKDGVAFVWDAATLAQTGSFRYTGEGWGLCHDGSRLVMSDGSSTLTFRDPTTFEVLGTVAVRVRGEPLVRLNELECVDGSVWANVWETPWIVRIDAATGQVTGALDTTGIIDPDPSEADPGAVLNGIAYDPVRDTFLLTGKLWPSMFEVRIGGT
jgi:glutamine cyclotransferase